MVLWSFPYPPTLLFFTLPFGLLSFQTGFVLWSAALTLIFVGAVYVIVHRANAVIAAPATFPAVVNFYIGQNAFLTAGLFGLALTTLERRPVVAGFFVALLTFKPQYGMMIPIALVASRNWRALASATVFSLALAAAAALAFGGNGWSSFFSNLVHRDPNLSPDSAFHVQLASVYGAMQSAGYGTATAWAAHVAVVLVLLVTVWIVWSKPTPYPLRASLLCVASLLASPYVLYYDVCMLAIPFAFLLSDGLRRGFLAGERTVMCISWLALSAGIPGAMIACELLLFLLWRRIVKLREVADTPAGESILVPGA